MNPAFRSAQADPGHDRCASIMPLKQENIFPYKTITYRRKQVRINLFFLISGDYSYSIIGLEFASNIAAIRIDSQEEDEEELQLNGGWI
jgi:hypothetical protein